MTRMHDNVAKKLNFATTLSRAFKMIKKHQQTRGLPYKKTCPTITSQKKPRTKFPIAYPLIKQTGKNPGKKIIKSTKNPDGRPRTRKLSNHEIAGARIFRC